MFGCSINVLPFRLYNFFYNNYVHVHQIKTSLRLTAVFPITQLKIHTGMRYKGVTQRC